MSGTWKLETYGIVRQIASSFSEVRCNNVSVVSASGIEYDAGLAHHRMAIKYLNAAQILYSATMPAIEKNALEMLAEYEPLVFLCGHSMELNFKAFLIAHGMPIKDAEAFSHDLGKLARECFAEGMAIPEWAKNTIDIANAVYSRSKSTSKRDYRARYPKKPEDEPTTLLFPHETIRTAEAVAELAGEAARLRASIVRNRLVQSIKS